MAGVLSSCGELLEIVHPDRGEDFLIGAIVLTVMTIVKIIVE